MLSVRELAKPPAGRDLNASNARRYSPIKDHSKPPPSGVRKGVLVMGHYFPDRSTAWRMKLIGGTGRGRGMVKVI